MTGNSGTASTFDAASSRRCWYAVNMTLYSGYTPQIKAHAIQIAPIAATRAMADQTTGIDRGLYDIRSAASFWAPRCPTTSALGGFVRAKATTGTEPCALRSCLKFFATQLAGDD